MGGKRVGKSAETDTPDRGTRDASAVVGSEAQPIGPVVQRNLLRLGYASISVHTSDLVDRLAKSGRTMSRQRISALMNSVRLDRSTLDALAKAIGVPTDELTRH